MRPRRPTRQQLEPTVDLRQAYTDRRREPRTVRRQAQGTAKRPARPTTRPRSAHLHPQQAEDTVQGRRPLCKVSRRRISMSGPGDRRTSTDSSPSATWSELAPDWMIGLKEVMVQIVAGLLGDQYQRGTYNGKTGVLLETKDRNSKDGRTVLVRIGTENHNIGTDFLVPVEPDAEQQAVVAVKGAYRGSEGRTLYANDDDWQVEIKGEKVVVNRRELCKRSS